MKQQDLADKLSVSKSYLSEIENGKKNPSMDIVERYSAVFSIPPSSIMFFAENVNSDGVHSVSDKGKIIIADKVLQFLRFIEANAKHDDKSVQLQR
tara:strand:- start:88 stop:375 length:288 start_codon:yes stop_codon:yes gene_type:complete